MDDSQIVDLYWQRSEDAVRETDAKYGKFCFRIAYNVLANKEDAEESVSDTYMTAWQTMPPKRPSALAPFLSKITRNRAISSWRAKSAAKRGGGEIALALEELDECVTGAASPESECLYQETVTAFRAFLDILPDVQRDVFLRRYFFLEPICEIADSFGFSQSKVKSMLRRTRLKLRAWLEKEELL